MSEQGKMIKTLIIMLLAIFAFIASNGLWVLIGVLWKERSLIVLNAGLTVIYVVGLVLQ